MFVVEDSSLSDIDEQISAYDKIIEYQKNEILKTTSVITNFQECLSQQNEKLKLFIFERDQSHGVKHKNVQTHLLPNNDLSLDLKKSDPRSTMKNETKSNNCESENCNVIQKRKLPNGTNECSKKKIICLRNPRSKIDVIEISELQKNKIQTIFVYGMDIYIGGSNGMLLRHTPGYTHVYDTNTKDDIRQIAVLNDEDKLSINVFTRDRLIIYEDITWYQKRQEIDIPGIGDVFVEDAFVYVPFQDGLLKRIGNTNLKKCSGVTVGVRLFVPCYGKSKLALISFEDGLLYTTSKEDPTSYRLVAGISNLIGVRRLMNQYFVCYSSKRLWLLNSAFHIIYNLRFENEIVLLEVCDGSVVVIDGHNEVHLYTLVRNRCLDAKMLFRETVNGVVTSATFANNKVYLGVGNEIVVISYH